MGRNDSYSLLDILQKSVGYDIALLTTYNFDIRLFEQAVLNSLFANNVRKVSVYVDAEELTKSLQSVRTCQIGRKYMINPIRINSTFHPKVVLLLGEKKARLILSSANITTPGYTTNNEVFNFIDYSDKDPKYHYQKWKDCQDQNITLLTFWEDQIINTPDIIESILLSKFGIYQKRIGASKCRIGKVSPKESEIFLLENHLQGCVRGSVRLGLYYKDELVSLMVFGKKRVSLGNKKSDDNKWELYRFCTKKNWQVVGGAKRLFMHFVQEYNPDSIESFSSNDISQGELYYHLGFQLFGHSISYWYIDKKMKRYHRYKFRKSELVKMGYDKTKTEFDITLGDMGLYQIYDSGQSKWIWKNPQNPR